MPAEKKEGEDKQGEDIVGLIVRNPKDLASLTPNEQNSGALIIVSNDLEAVPLTSEEAVHPDGRKETAMQEAETDQTQAAPE